MNTIDQAVPSKSQRQILHFDPAVLSDFQRQIFQLERDDTSELIHFEKGTTPILLSAPHTVNFLKEDGNFKMREAYTKAIVKYLALKTGAFLMIKENSDGIDPNKSEMEDYKRGLLEIIEQYQIQLVLDIHGAASHHDFAIEIGSLDGVSARIQTIESLKTALKDQGIAPVAKTIRSKAAALLNPSTIIQKSKFCSSKLIAIIVISPTPKSFFTSVNRSKISLKVFHNKTQLNFSKIY